MRLWHGQTELLPLLLPASLSIRRARYHIPCPVLSVSFPPLRPAAIPLSYLHDDDAQRFILVSHMYMYLDQFQLQQQSPGASLR